MSFHLPIYADAMAHASINDLATRDEGFIYSCQSSFRSSSILGGIFLDQTSGSECCSSMSRLCSDDSVFYLDVCFCTTCWISGIFISMPIHNETSRVTTFDLYDGVFIF
jgi:hypothetical protein